MKIIQPLLYLSLTVLLCACGLSSPGGNDQAALRNLREAGSDMSKPHPFDFYLYHTEKTAAVQMCDQLLADGFRITVREGALGGEWLCLVRKTFVPNLDNLNAVQAQLARVADQHGGEYDGWETVVVP